jgi:diguanylate cyclase (GGDEF)-like protein/hemerythrin-like metal-binding protein/PAS domain S-box-containing protein
MVIMDLDEKPDLKVIDIFPWNEHFNTGLSVIDEQHRKLVEILNKLASNIAYNSNEAVLCQVFDELIDYTDYHFQTEEALWHQYLPNDDLDSSHQKVHNDFIATVLKLKNSQDSRPLSEVAEETLEFLARWLASHILETDQHMAHIIFALQDGYQLDVAKEQANEKMSDSRHLLIDIILSIYSTLSSNTLHLMRELKNHKKFENEVSQQQRYRDLLLALSTQFINLPLDEIDVNIQNALEKMSNYAGADRAYIFDYNFQKQIVTNTYEWCGSGIESQIENLQEVPFNILPQWIESHSKSEYIKIQDVSNHQDIQVREALLPQDIKSIISFPIIGNGKCRGFIGFDYVKKHHKFYDSEIRLLELFSKLLNNIEERKENELALSNERSFLKTLLKAIPDPIWLKDINGVYLLCNSRFEDLFGAKEADIIGKTDFDFVEKNLAMSFIKNDKKVILSGKPHSNEEILTFSLDTHQEVVNTSKVPIFDEDGKVSGVLGVSRDITAIKNIQKELENKEHYQRALLDNFPFMVWLKDKNSRFLALNRPMANSCGVPSMQSIAGKSDHDIWPKALADEYLKDDLEVLASKASKTIEKCTETSTGKIWSETYKSAVSVNGEVIGTVGFARDITSRKELERNLIKERNLFEYYIDTVEAIIISLDLKGNLTLINRKGCELLGYNAKDLIGKNWFEISLGQPESQQKAYFIFLEMIQGNLEGLEYSENTIINKSSKEHLIAWHNACLYDDEGNVTGILSSGEDITILREQQKRLEHMAHYDTLTNLPNRILLSDRLEQAMLKIKRNTFNLAVIYLDLDGFKEINDTYGHNHGDLLLKALSNKMQQILRSEDTIGRFGGDEFVIVLSDLKDEQTATGMFQRILETVSRPILLNDISVQVSASIGVAFYNYDDYLDADQLIRHADQAMYQAKLSGKNRFHIFDNEQDKDIRSHHEDLEAIEKAINNEQFTMFYQPKINMRSGKVVGAEALIRWNHPEHGLLYPGSFLPTIENHHLSVELGYWVIENVLKQIVTWKKENINITVSINISPLQLQENNFTVKLFTLLKKYPEVSSSDFEFEILETSALENINNISYIMKECNKMGIAFLLDDFGTGYSSLSYLKNLPAKQLKIDRSFVHNMLDNTDDMAILEGVIGLANAFRRGVIAEGVESIEQGNMLLRLGCEEAQGYIIAKPMPAEQIIQWMIEWHPPYEWKDIKTLSRDDSALLYALTEHKAWFNEAIAYLRGDKTTPPPFHEAECRFDSWFNTQGIQRYKNTNGFQEIMQLHKKMHENINSFLKQHQKNTLNNVDDTIVEVGKNRDYFTNEFTRLFLLD